MKFKSYGIITIPTNKSETAKLAIKTLIRVLNRLNLAMLNSISKFPNIIGRNMIASIAQNNIPKYIYAKRTVPVAAFVTVSSVELAFPLAPETFSISQISLLFTKSINRKYVDRKYNPIYDSVEEMLHFSNSCCYSK
jgi:hypothetical protein